MSQTLTNTTDIHALYRQLLERPEVRRLAAQFGLDRGVTYEFVGERRSFHGKATRAEGEQRVRLPANTRPEPYLLLTLLHEWAHLLVYRQPQKNRPTPHGADWRRYYVSLVHAGVGAGLFPGNEPEVLRHAAAGEAQTRFAQLRDANGAPLLPPAPVLDPVFRAGDTVSFLDTRGQQILGQVRRVNTRTYTVVTADGLRSYRVPIGYASLTAARLSTPAPDPAPSPWQVGAGVRFTDQGGRPRRGTIRRVNLRTLTVDADDGLCYRVGYGHPALRRA